MKPQSLQIRINRLVVDAPLVKGMALDTLSAAIESALAARVREGAGQVSQTGSDARVASPLVNTIAGGVAGKLNAMNPYVGSRTPGGGDGSL